ncbi:S1 family peptidase [Kineococcus rubinsiae]|uniref:S1 family peptidase n=1 Tax=Kineococcus rubinsiae TaxID=2609562 RepID=UPI001430B7AC|nr:trypsin-like serine protease [Kineococcus rubinsiae]NIZ90333.1 S1 family peptidase [Kineococcus rubinsiae]
MAIRFPSSTRVALGGVGVAAAVAVSTLSAAPAQAIANGEDVPDGRYGFVADLEARGIPAVGGGTRDSACSAALIASEWLVSAGHCFHNGDPAGRTPTSGWVGPGQAVPYRVDVLLGQATRSGTGGQRRQVVYVQQVPIAGTDLALARLDRPVTDVAPVRLAVEPAASDEVVRLAGWGATASPASITQRPNRMQTGLFTVTGTTTTNLTVRGRSPEATTSPCPYDSGAPYFRETPTGVRLVGIESGGPACPHDQDDMATRTDLAAVRSWVGGARLRGLAESTSPR